MSNNNNTTSYNNSDHRDYQQNHQGGAEAAVDVAALESSSSSGGAAGGGAGAAFGLFSADFKKNDDLKEMLESNKESLKLEAMKRIVGLKKLVYVYLVRYAEEQQDLALLSISTFQRALKDPNQMIRASALRVLSSIRVAIIVPIMMLAIKESASDMSPLDPDQKEHLIEVIEKLLKDKSTLVAGSVVMAFEEVCPDRIDLIHKNYRKLCNLLVDVEEWGQVVIINMLTRYARTQFTSPWKEGAMFDENNVTAFYDSDSEEKKGPAAAAAAEAKPYMMDPDHRLLLRNTKPLLQSRNTAVVMAVGQLYWHLAPMYEYVVLQNIATMSIQRKGMFEPYLKSFYVRSTDPTHIKTLKLEILTNLANEANISTILREFQTYVKSQDKVFAAATIHAIGRCATNISEVTDTCLNGLVLLLSNRDETVVAESVGGDQEPAADPAHPAHILWLIGEYCERVPKIAPDVLRKAAKSFTGEEDIVKLQVVNMAAKLYLTNSSRCGYILNLGKYDQNYDIRDRTRFIRQLIVPNEKSGALGKYARRILLNVKASAYLELSDWPQVAPDQSVRNVEVIVEPEESEQESSDESAKGSSQSGSSESDADQEKKKEKQQQKKNKNKKNIKTKATTKTVDRESEENNNGPVASSQSEDSSSDSESESSSSDSDSGTEQKKTTSSEPKPKPKVQAQPKKEVSLLDLDDVTPPSRTTPSASVFSPSLLSDLEGLSLSGIHSPMQSFVSIAALPITTPACLSVRMIDSCSQAWQGARRRGKLNCQWWGGQGRLTPITPEVGRRRREGRGEGVDASPSLILPALISLSHPSSGVGPPPPACHSNTAAVEIAF
ncbi:hypothetical protein CRUP_006779 [Coryphaenoides rupestris]|nr:hypothetical protein CRUP_006779 [Coryphaenoides rupestris]